MITLSQITPMHNAYIANPSQHNNYNRFGYDGRSATIGKFLQQNAKAMNSLQKIDKISKLNGWVTKFAPHYATFAKSVNPAASDMDLSNWFRGAIGEWFIIDCFLYFGQTFITMSIDKNQVSLEQIQMIVPTIYTNCADFGVDFIGIDKNNNGIAGQVKFWNPWGSALQVNYDTIAKTNSQAIEEDWIDPKQKRSIYFFWLGAKRTGSMLNNISQWLLSKDCPLTKYDKVVYVDGNDLEQTCTPVFWSTIFKPKISIL